MCSVFDLVGFAVDIDLFVARRGNSNDPNNSELRGVDALQPPAKSAGNNPDDALNRAAGVVGFASSAAYSLLDRSFQKDLPELNPRVLSTAISRQNQEGL
jgi:hypothetical protein